MKKSLDAIEEIVKVIEKHKDELKEKYGVKKIGIFGSFVRGEAKEDSDVDILVEFEKPIGFFKFLELEDYLGSLIGRKVDLVSKKALKPHIGKYILEEVVTV
ncbi:MAG: nucleotidyltransferase family protein [Archaeoglobus sp.]|nr:nucleotidyltransferase family protein [Archaeoglobus sp.]